MKKWMYVIFPGLALAVFLSLYFPAKRLAEERVQQEAEAVTRQKAAEDAHRKELEDKARAASDRRAAENAQQLAAQEAARETKRLGELHAIQADAATADKDVERYTQEANDLQTRLESLQKQREALTREDFDLAKQVELNRVNAGNADLEIQRMVDMIAARAAQSAMANPPAPVRN